MVQYIFHGTAKKWTRRRGSRTNCHHPKLWQRSGVCSGATEPGHAVLGDWMTTSGGCYWHLMELRGAPLRNTVTSVRLLDQWFLGPRVSEPFQCWAGRGPSGATRVFLASHSEEQTGGVNCSQSGLWLEEQEMDHSADKTQPCSSCEQSRTAYTDYSVASGQRVLLRHWSVTAQVLLHYFVQGEITHRGEVPQVYEEQGVSLDKMSGWSLAWHEK